MLQEQKSRMDDDCEHGRGNVSLSEVSGINSTGTSQGLDSKNPKVEAIIYKLYR